MLSIILPTLNEAKNIEALAKGISETLGPVPYELIVVDDDSPDLTWKIASGLPDEYNVRVLRRQNAKGLASAVVAGFEMAKGEILAVMDADLSHPPALLSEMFELISEGADLVVGSRVIDGGGVEDWPWYRRLLSASGRCMIMPLMPVRDSMSGYFMLRKEVIQGVVLKPIGYKILLEILFFGKYRRLVEVPYLFKTREAGTSKMTLRTNLDFCYQSARLYLYRLRRGFRRR